MRWKVPEVTAAALAAGLSGAAAYGGTAMAGEAMAGTLPEGRVIVYPGETAAQAIHGQSVAARSAALHAAWLQSGHAEAAPEAKPALTLTAGTVLSNTLEVGNAFAFPAVQFSYTAGTPGLNSAVFDFTSPAGPRVLETSFAQAPYSTHGTIDFAFPAALPFYLANGAWTLTGATLYDNSGNTTVYTAPQIAALFTATSFTVINRGPVDSTPPVLGVGHVLTPTISLSAPQPELKATLQVSDNLSGVGFAILILTPPGVTYSEGQIVTVPLPVKSGTLTMYDEFYPGDPTGTWNFYEVEVCDVAQNCDEITDPQAIFNLLGANSVTVTK